MKTTTARMCSVVVAACFVLSMAATTAGCFSKGKKGYICKSSKDCKGKLRCKTFRGKGKKRKACVSSGTRSISSSDTYTIYAVYMSWIFVILLGIGAVVVVVLAIRNKGKQAAQAGAGGAGPNAPPPGQPPAGPPPGAGPPTA